ncbi:MAG: NUDIX hydrolase [Thermodesulfobacteriota bacterium]
MRTVQQISSGGVVFRQVADKVEIALIAVKGGKVWELPKGRVEKGEDIARTAHREVNEETGLDSRTIKKIDHIQYFYCHKEAGETNRFFKIVYFFLMEFTGGDVTDHDSEVDECRWFLIDEAIEKVEYDNEKDILRKAEEMILSVK